MKRHRFIIEGANLAGDFFVIGEKEVVHQIQDVLKLQEDEELVVCDGQGNEARGKIVFMSKNEIKVEVVERVKNTNEPKRKVVLCCALLKHENFDWVVQKATEVGVSEIIPLLTKRTVKQGMNRLRLEKIIKEAAEQSGRGVLLKLHEPMNLEEALETIPIKDKFFLDFSDQKLNGQEIQKLCSDGESGSRGGGKILIFVGPEGGWDPSEQKLAEESGCLVRSLGALTLRAETAATVATYVVCSS